MIFLGDIHGVYGKIPSIVETIVQVGDLGIGFVPFRPRKNFWFIRGNHDNPDLCRRTSGFLGDYGVRELSGIKFGFVSGAYSIDRDARTPGLDWWAEEELSGYQFHNAEAVFRAEQPEILVTHDCPESIRIKIYKDEHDPSKTSIALADIFEAHRPKLWIFGHHHVSFRAEADGCRFVGLGINEIWWIGKD